MTTPVGNFGEQLQRISELDIAARAILANEASRLAARDHVGEVQLADLQQWLKALSENDTLKLENESPALLAAVLHLLWRGCESVAAKCREAAGPCWPEGTDLVPRIGAIYQHLGADSGARFHLLKCLTEIGNEEALEQFAELIVLDPPQDEEQATLVFTSLFQRQNSAAGVLFPRLLDGLSHVQVAAPILDLASHLMRMKLVDRHPASEHVQALAGLLGQVVGRLEQLTEKNPLAQPAKSVEALRSSAQQVAAGSALVVTLCDALGLIGNHDVVGALYNALELRHRRIRTEAAAALARLGQPTGIEALRQLVEEPATRVRATAYLGELGLAEEVKEEFRTPAAQAEGELALWLAEPTQFGVPPVEMELLDECRQYWPGYDETQDCFLFRFVYRLKDHVLQGVGLAGPAIHAISCDLNDLPLADIYALYAGWQAEHEEISERPLAELSEPEQRTVTQQLEHSASDEYESVQPLSVGLFLGELHVVATATRGGQPGVLILDGGNLNWFPTQPTRRPLGPTELYWLFKGRKILKTFN